MAASTALPPWRSTSSPTAVAVASTVEIAPPYPEAVGPSAAAAVAGAETDRDARESAATVDTSRIELPK
jgi:hypothetical protein